MKKNIITYIKGFLYGMIFGITFLSPGISIGTMAVILNVYEKLFIKVNNFAGMKKNLNTIIPLCIGGVCSIFLFSNLILFLINNHNQILYFSFMGMIAGCIPIVLKQMGSEKIKFRHITVMAAFLALMLFAAFKGGDLLTNQTLEQLGGISPTLLVWLFVAGLVSATGMLVPGISGSTIILILGAYNVTVEAITTSNHAILVPVGAGIALGLFSSFKLIKMLLNNHAQMLYYAIIGLIIGSVFVLYPGFSLDLTGVLSIAFALGFAVLPFSLLKTVKTRA